MVAVAIAGLTLDFVVWLSGWIVDFLAFVGLLLWPASPGLSREIIIDAGPYSFSSASPALSNS
jgi:hypothetical protein